MELGDAALKGKTFGELQEADESCHSGTHLDNSLADPAKEDQPCPGDRYESSGFLAWLSPAFKDEQVEHAFFCHKHKQTPHRTRHAKHCLCGLAFLWILLPSNDPPAVWRFYRMNNVLSAAATVAAVNAIAKSNPATWLRYDDTGFILILHNLLYNSLACEQVGRFAQEGINRQGQYS